MSSAQLSAGWLSPLVGGAGGGAGGPAGFKVLFALRDSAGVLQPGIDLSAAGVIKISVNGGSFANRVGPAPTNIGFGLYYYLPDITETPGSTGTVVLSVQLAGYQDPMEREDYGPSLASVRLDVLNSITTAQGTLEGDILSAVVAINAHTDTEAGVINAHTDTVAIAINAHTDTEAGVINAHTDSALTTTQTAINAHTDAQVAPVTAQISRMLGLQGENSVLDGGAGFPQVQYNARRLMTGARLRVFASAAAAAAATPGANDGTDGEIYRWAMAGTDTGTGLDATFTRRRTL